MTMRNTSSDYGSVAKCLHWIVAILIIGMLTLGTIMTELDKSNPIRPTLYMIHKSTGVTIFITMIIRIIWRWINPAPAFPDPTPPWQRKAARWSHILLYVLIVIMLLSGMVLSTAGNHPIPFWGLFTFKLPFVPLNDSLKHFTGKIHLILAWTIAVLLLLHVLALIKHHCIDKVPILQRMLPKKRG